MRRLKSAGVSSGEGGPRYCVCGLLKTLPSHFACSGRASYLSLFTCYLSPNLSLLTNHGRAGGLSGAPPGSLPCIPSRHRSWLIYGSRRLWSCARFGPDKRQRILRMLGLGNQYGWKIYPNFFEISCVLLWRSAKPVRLITEAPGQIRDGIKKLAAIIRGSF